MRERLRTLVASIAAIAALVVASPAHATTYTLLGGGTNDVQFHTLNAVNITYDDQTNTGYGWVVLNNTFMVITCLQVSFDPYSNYREFFISAAPLKDPLSIVANGELGDPWYIRLQDDHPALAGGDAFAASPTGALGTVCLADLPQTYPLISGNFYV